MAKFTADRGLAMNYYGHDLTGPAGTEFRLPDSLYEDFARDFGHLGLTWTAQDEIALAELGGPHTHDDLYSGLAHAHAAGDHPDLATHETLGLAAAHSHPYAATIHTHAESQVTDLTASLAAKADSGHTHAYAADPHTHDYAASSHSHIDADLPAGLARDSEVSAAIVAHEASATHGGSGSIPTGVIVMWAGLVSAIPSGWALCDGLNGTPDLRDRFVKGAAAGVDPGTTGGASTHAHATHTSAGDHTHADHSGTRKGGTSNPATILDGVHSHDSQGAHTHDAHSTESHEPPYYALAFIQKV